MTTQAVPAQDNIGGDDCGLTHVFTAKTSDTFVAGQIVAPEGTDGTTVTATTSANMENALGLVRRAVTTAAAGTRLEVEFFVAGQIRWMINGGTCTFGSKVCVEGTDGRVTDVGATPASGSCIGQMIGATTSTDGDRVPILIALH